ncbi:MAG: hypothetical protein EHM21_00105 [Chloroflexi bacterium]|nr:MAG: hypothetical protein EHM21_00105 [Chloroflexota bacterium]
MEHPAGNEILSIHQLSRFRYGKPDELRRLEREQQELYWALEGRSQFDGERLFGDQMPERLRGGSAPDQDHVRTLLEKNQATLNASRPPADLTPIQRNKYATLERELRQDITEGMLSTSMANDPSEYNVDMELAWQHYKSSKAIAWMNCRQILDPTNDSPFFTSIESLRPTTPPMVDLRKLRQNWDNIAFTDAQERAALQLDDSVYVQFLRLKALDWSDKGIMRELGLTRAGLEVAMARLRDERASQREPELIEDDDFPSLRGKVTMPEEWETPTSPETDEEDEEPLEDGEEVPTIFNGHLTPSMAVVPGAKTKTTAQKAAWLRRQLEVRHIASRVMARAIGLEGLKEANFQMRVTKGNTFTEDEWKRIGMVLAYFDEDPTWIAPYEKEGSWKRSRWRAQEVALSRPEG